MLAVKDLAPTQEHVDNGYLLPVRGFEECVMIFDRAAYARVGTDRALGCYVDVFEDANGPHWPTRPLWVAVQLPLPMIFAN